MIQTRLFSAALLMAGLAQASAALAAAPNVIINQGVANSQCTVTPSSGTVFTLDSSGNVLVNGAYGQDCPSGGTGGGFSGPPAFNLNPNPSDLTIPGASLGNTGGTVNPNFVAYFANNCTGSIAVTPGCAAVSGSWAGGTVCTKGASGASANYCTPNSAAVSIPGNSTGSTCNYTFQASCSGTSTVPSQQVTVAVASTPTGGGSCSVNDVGELNSFGYTRQCGGTIHSFVAGLSPYWDNTYKGVMSGVDWPGNTAQHGKGISVTVNANQYASFSFNTGTVASGASFQTNPSYGTVGLISVSTTPGDFFSGTSVCVGSSLTISSKPNTVAGTNCKLAQNTLYYINFSSASYSAPHDTVCTSGSCATGWIWYLYGN